MTVGLDLISACDPATATPPAALPIAVALLFTTALAMILTSPALTILPLSIEALVVVSGIFKRKAPEAALELRPLATEPVKAVSSECSDQPG